MERNRRPLFLEKKRKNIKRETIFHIKHETGLTWTAWTGVRRARSCTSTDRGVNATRNGVAKRIMIGGAVHDSRSSVGALAVVTRKVVGVVVVVATFMVG